MVGINENSDADLIQINPNPNNGTFSIDISGLGNISNYYILDMAGRKTAFNKVVNQSIISFDIENNQKGIYFLQLITDKKSYSKKFIIK
ncbi:T9SS type A sorting domain-containing protein [Desulfosarcina sp.]|nr:T9SS type A sorting domain-containing protein [Desulfosarcina sp.]